MATSYRVFVVNDNVFSNLNQLQFTSQFAKVRKLYITKDSIPDSKLKHFTISINGIKITPLVQEFELIPTKGKNCPWVLVDKRDDKLILAIDGTSKLFGYCPTLADKKELIYDIPSGYMHSVKVRWELVTRSKKIDDFLMEN